MLLAEELHPSAQHQHLGMGERVMVGLDAVAGGGEEIARGIDQHGADRHLAARRRCFGLRQRQLHLPWGSGHRR